jgi:hypothetical protein
MTIEISLEKIADVFADVARSEDEFFSANDIDGKGIFFMPEMAFAYQCGKAVMGKRKEIFGENPVNWKREESIDSSGPIDLIFEVGKGTAQSYKILIEFKMRDTVDKYLSDIRKLAQLSNGGNTHCIFCVLVDSFSKEDPDPRIDSLSQHSELKGLITKYGQDDFPAFPTRQDWYKKQVYCQIAVWSVSSNNRKI